MNRPKNLALFLLLVGLLGAVQVQASSAELPELTVELADIGANQCRNVEWALPHSRLQVVVCNRAGADAPSAEGTDKEQAVNAAELHQQAVTWREQIVSSEFANGMLSMQFTLDKLPHRSLHPHWRVFINLGTFGCQNKIELRDDKIEFFDPCNHNRYTGDGRAVGVGYPSLAIPPYTIQGTQLIVGRMPAEGVKPEALPEVSFTETGSPAEQLVRAARWGRVPLAKQLIKSGVDVNASISGGSTALLIAVMMRQPEIVAFLIEQGANVNVSYPDGLTPLKISQMVEAPELEAMLLKAGAMAEREK